MVEIENLCDRRDSPCGCPTKAPSDEGAVVFRRKMTEGEKAINIKLSLSLLPSRLRRATYCPLAVSRFCLCGLERRTKSTAAPTDAPFIRHRRRSHTLPVRGRLYFHIIVNLISPENSFVFVSLFGQGQALSLRVSVVCKRLCGAFNKNCTDKFKLIRAIQFICSFLFFFSLGVFKIFFSYPNSA